MSIPRANAARISRVPPGANENLGAIVIWDSHPVQYKAPVYRELEALCPGLFTVIYGSDCSVRGHLDPGFGRRVAWDGNLLDGYNSTVLHKERGTALMGFRSLSGSGVHAALLRLRPRAVMISQFLYESDFAALISAGRLGVPVAIRQETQDEAFRRGRTKSFLRSVFYRRIYKRVDRACFIGELNREHLLRHGFASYQLTRSPYCTPSFFDGMSDGERARARQSRREAMGIGPEQIVILFSGKLIAKKNPDLLLEAVKQLPQSLQRVATVLFMGSGEMEGELRRMTRDSRVPVKFLGFVNQDALPMNYLAADVLVLPSRWMGETWGLVVNEALHAGCGVVMTDAVGCHREFGSWERVRVIRQGDASACARALTELSNYERAFDWCAKGMRRYSVRAAAEGIVSAFADLSTTA